MIRHETARRIASEWHGGQWSGLYALSSSGAIIIDRNFNRNPETHINAEGDLVLTSDPDTLATITALDEISELLAVPQRGNYPQVLTKGQRTELTDLVEYINHHGPRNASL